MSSDLKIDLSYRGLGDWASFIEMLSIERIYRFAEELGLPITPPRQNQVIRLSRACLEVMMFPYASMQADPGFFWEFPHYWPLYRRQEAVLVDPELVAHSLRHTSQSDNEITWAIFTELQEWIGANLSADLEEWYLNNYQLIRGSYHCWLHEFLRLGRKYSRGGTREIESLTTVPQLDCLAEFCERFYNLQNGIRRRFVLLEAEARDGEPSGWEAVLQTFPVDSHAGSRYAWLHLEVSGCVNVRAFRSEWQRLRGRLGPDETRRLTNWVRQEAELEHGAGYLPEIPRLIW